MDIKNIIEEGRFACVGSRGGNILFSLRGIGIKPLILVYETSPELLAQTDVCDKVIGKAAAMVCVLAGTKSVWGAIMSRSAAEYLEKRGIAYGYGKLVDRIENRTGTGICPLEDSILNIESPEEGYTALKLRIAELMSGK